jgi:hypothetical protein
MTERSVSHNTFVIERSYPAQPTTVFGAWSDAAAREIWMDDPDYKSDGSNYEFDFRVGGHERFSGITPEGETYRYEGVIFDIVPRAAGQSSPLRGKERFSMVLRSPSPARISAGCSTTSVSI